MSNVKAGDLAIIIKSAAGNEGKVVTVLGPMGIAPFFNGKFWHRQDGFCWMVSFASSVTTSRGMSVTHGPFPDAWLRPVSGLPDATDIDERLREPA